MLTAPPPQRFARPGFTLLEMLATVTIIAIVAMLVIPRLSTHGVAAKQHVCSQYKADLNAAIEDYFFEKSTYPATLDDLHDANYYPEPIPVCPLTQTAYQIDPATNRVDGHDH